MSLSASGTSIFTLCLGLVTLVYSFISTRSTLCHLPKLEPHAHRESADNCHICIYTLFRKVRAKITKKNWNSIKNIEENFKKMQNFLFCGSARVVWCGEILHAEWLHRHSTLEKWIPNNRVFAMMHLFIFYFSFHRMPMYLKHWRLRWRHFLR